MMLSTLEGRGEIEPGEDFSAMQANVLQNETADTVARIAALSLLGRRKAMEHREIIRQYAMKECPERRVAVASLGQIVHSDDKQLIEQALEETTL